YLIHLMSEDAVVRELGSFSGGMRAAKLVIKVIHRKFVQLRRS
ncbi:MAG: hypothetical protein RL077_5819, partial [Verrucomicrobiota bacterium]